MLKKAVKKLLPSKCYNFLRMRPKVVLVSDSLWGQIRKINAIAWTQDPDSRGDLGAALRKQGHILDKGLQSVERRPGHGGQVAEGLRRLLDKAPQEESESARWARLIHGYHCRLQADELLPGEYSAFEFRHDSTIDFDSLLLLLKERRSLRHFDTERLPEADQIRKVLQGAVWAPSSCNRQTISNFFTCDWELALQCSRQNKGATSVTGKFAFVCVCYDTRSYHLPQESLTGLIDVSLGFQNSLLLAHALGLGGCILNWSHADRDEEARLRGLLSIPEYYSIAFNAIIGIPRFGAPVPARKSEGEYIIER